MIKFIRTNFGYDIMNYLVDDVTDNTIFITNENNINYMKKQMIKHHLNSKVSVMTINQLLNKIAPFKPNKLLDKDKQRLYFVLAFFKTNHKLNSLKDYNTYVIDSIIDIYNMEAQNRLIKTPYRSSLSNDIELIIQTYLDLIEGHYIDNNGLYQEVIRNMDNSKYIGNNIILDYLPFLNKTEIEFIKTLSDYNSLTIFTYNDKITDKNKLFDDFYNNLKEKEYTEIIINNDLNDEKMAYLKQVPYNFIPHNIKLYEAKDPYNEVLFVCNQILKLIKEKKAKLDDFTLILNNYEDYEIYFHSIFKANNINYSKNEITTYDLFEFILNMLKLPSFPKNRDIIDLLNYHYIKIDQVWFESYIKFINDNYLNDELYNDDYIVIKELLDKLKNLKQLRTEKLACEVYYLVNNILTENDYSFDLNLDTYNIFVDFINLYLDVFKDEKIEFTIFIDIFEYWFSNINVKEKYVNEIKIVRLKDSYTVKTKYNFVLGLNEGVIPSTLKTNILLPKPEEIYSNYPLFAGILKEQISLLYVFLNMEIVYLSYPKIDSNNKKVNSSTVIKEIKNIYPQIETIKDDLYLLSYSKKLFQNQYRTYTDGFITNEIDNYFDSQYIYDRIKTFYHPKLLDKKMYKGFLNNQLYLSASKIDTYVKCPFKYYLENVLKLNPDKKEIYDNRIVGTFIHGLLESLVNNIDSNPNQIKDNYLDNFKKNHSLTRNHIYLYFFEKLGQNTLFLWDNIKRQLDGKFKAMYTELNINTLGGNNKIHYVIDDVNVYMSGIIDRVDSYNDYFRIIDYKTGDKKIDWNDFVNGINLQLFIYMTILSNQTNKIVSGIFYMPAFAKFTSDSSEYKLNGIFLDHEENIEALGGDEINNYINAYSRGKISKNLVYDDEKYKQIMKLTEEKIKEVATNIIEGGVDIYPIKSTKICDYCKFGSICGTEVKTKNNHRIKKYSLEEINEIIGGD